MKVSTSNVTVEDDKASRILDVSMKRCRISPDLRVSKSSSEDVKHDKIIFH